MTDIFKEDRRILELHGVPHGEELEALRYIVGEKGIALIEPCSVAGNGGDMTCFQVRRDNGSDVIVTTNDLSEVVRTAVQPQ